MKTRASLLLATLLPLSGAFAQTTTWNGSGTWFTESSWDTGIPNASTDAVVIKDTQPYHSMNSSSTSTPAVVFRDLDIRSIANLAPREGYSNENQLRLYFQNGSSGRNVVAQTSGLALLGLYFNGSSTFSSISLSSTSSVANNLSLSLNPGINITATNGISLGGSSGRNASISHGDIREGNATINGDITFNRGSRYWVTNNGSAGATLFLNGNVTLQAGTFLGDVPSFMVGRVNNSDTGFTVDIRDHLALTAGFVSINRGKTLNVGSATFASGTSLEISGIADAVGDTTFHSRGDLILNGGRYAAVNATGATGSYRLDVDGNFVLGTGSTMTLRSEATGITTLHLAGNLDLQATSLTSGNLNQLRVVLDGTEPQTLEAAVLGGNETFALHTLTIDSGVNLVSLVNEHTNLGADEFFKTENLVVNGATTLNVGTLGFYVGNTLLEAGNTYTTYGGPLTVIPEPSTLALLGGTLGFALLRRRRK